MLRVLLAVSGVIALGLGVLWALGTGHALGSDFNTQRQVSKRELAGLVVLGLAGVLATLVAGIAGLAYAKTEAVSWLRPAAAGALLALPLGLAWIALALIASSS
jgi:hypothetical protein